MKEDLSVINASLTFINDLLRSMLDVHRASNKQMKLDLKPTDILKDILQPASAMLYRRDETFQVKVDCPDNLIVKVDRIRLKQIVLNLANNSRKFVSTGHISLRAEIVDDGENVHLFVEDSGPGIPASKRDNLFVKFQDSLDSLSQG